MYLMWQSLFKFNRWGSLPCVIEQSIITSNRFLLEYKNTEIPVGFGRRTLGGYPSSSKMFTVSQKLGLYEVFTSFVKILLFFIHAALERSSIWLLLSTHEESLKWGPCWKWFGCIWVFLVQQIEIEHAVRVSKFLCFGFNIGFVRLLSIWFLLLSDLSNGCSEIILLNINLRTKEFFGKCMKSFNK